MDKEDQLIRTLDSFVDVAQKFTTVPDPPVTPEDTLRYLFYGAACWCFSLYALEQLVDGR